MYIFRTDSPLSYTSITPSATPELTGLSPAPRPRLCITSGCLPCDENVSPHKNFQRSRAPLSRASETPSTAGESTSSRATFWSAVASVTDDDDDEYDFRPTTKADSGILVSPVLPPSPVRRESISSGSGSTARMSHMPASTTTPSCSSSHSKSQSQICPRPCPPTSSSTHSSQRLHRPSRQSTATSTWTSSTTTTAVPPKMSRNSIESPPRAYMKPTHADIREPLGLKYPNDRCHGAFLPFRSEFAPSKDSLFPVVFAPDTPSAHGSSLPLPAVRAAGFTEKGPELGPVTIDWKGNAARRREYEAADQRSKGWRKWTCGLFGRKERVFWDGDDGGSVRRYRLDLPPESPEEMKVVRENEIQKEMILQKGVTGVKIGVEVQGGESWDGEGRRDERRVSRQQKRSSRSV